MISRGSVDRIVPTRHHVLLCGGLSTPEHDQGIVLINRVVAGLVLFLTTASAATSGQAISLPFGPTAIRKSTRCQRSSRSTPARKSIKHKAALVCPFYLTLFFDNTKSLAIRTSSPLCAHVLSQALHSIRSPAFQSARNNFSPPDSVSLRTSQHIFTACPLSKQSSWHCLSKDVRADHLLLAAIRDHSLLAIIISTPKHARQNTNHF